MESKFKDPHIKDLLKELKKACRYLRKEWIEEVILMLGFYGVKREEAFAAIESKKAL